MEATSETKTSDVGLEVIVNDSPNSDFAVFLGKSITCIDIKDEDARDPETCYIEVFHNEEDSSDKYVIPYHTYVPRKLFLDHDFVIPEVMDSSHFEIFEIDNFSTLTDPLVCDYRPPKIKLLNYISDLIHRNSNEVKFGISLEYGKFDIDGLRVFEDCQLKEDVLNESIWFGQKNYSKPNCNHEVDITAVREFQKWLLDYGSECDVPLQGKVSLKACDIADLTCDRWVNDSLISHFVDLIQINSHPRVYVVNFAHSVDLENEVQQIKSQLSNRIHAGQILFLSHIGIHPDCDETFMSQEDLHTSHYAFGSFLFCDGKVRYADTMGLKIPSEFIEKVNFILSHFDIEPTYHYCHDPRGTIIEDEPRFITHNCTEYCSKHYPLQMCTNICGVALLIGMCIATSSQADFVEMCEPGSRHARFAYLSNISRYSQFLRLVLIQYLVKSLIDLNVISDSANGERSMDSITYPNSYKAGMGQNRQSRRKNVLSIRAVSDLIQDAVLKYTKSKENPAMQLVCRLKSSGKLVTKSFQCSPLGQEDGDCVAAIQSFLNHSDCRDWLSSYVGEPSFIKELNREKTVSHLSTLNSDSDVCKASLSDCGDPEPIKRNRRKNNLDIGYVSDLICDAHLKFVKIQGKPALRLSCIIRTNGKSVTKTFPCSSRGQDDAECVAKIQKFINSDDCAEWINGYIKVIETRKYQGKEDALCMKLSYRKNVVDIKNVSHLVFDAKVRFIKLKSKPYVQLLCRTKSNGRRVSKLFPQAAKESNSVSVAQVQKFINSNSCETWLHSCLSKNLLDISNIRNLVYGARLKYFRIKGNPIVQLICHMKSTRKLVKKTFAFSSCGIGDTESVAEIQKYIDSSNCIAWLTRCRNRINLTKSSLDISNISDLVDEAKLKFQSNGDKPTMQLICHLSNIQKSVSKNFPCSSLGPKDNECIDKIQDFVRSIECVAWLYKFMIKNPLVHSSNDNHKKPVVKWAGIDKSLCVSPIGSNIKVEVEQLDEDEAMESFIEVDSDSSIPPDEQTNEELSSQANVVTRIQKKNDTAVVNSEEKLLNGTKPLNLTNVSDLVDDVKVKLVEVEGKSKMCMLFRIKYTRKLVKRYIPCSTVSDDSVVLIAEAQKFLDSKKCVKWLSKSINYLSGQTVLDIKNIVDLVDYAKLKYVQLKDKPVMYLVCRIKSSKKIARKAFQCYLVRKDYVNCINEIQNFVDSSNCRTWLSVYTGKSSLEIESTEEIEQDMIDAVDTQDSSLNYLSSMQSVSLAADWRGKFNIENISILVQDVKLRYLNTSGESVLQLLCQLKCSKKYVTYCFPCSSLGLNDTKCLTEIQNFIHTNDCIKWLLKCKEKYTPLTSESFESVGKPNLETVKKEPEHTLNTESTHSQVQIIERVCSTQQCTSVSLPNKQTLDLGNISNLIYSAKLIFVNVKEKPLLQLLCQVTSTGKLITKSFSCSSLGLNDKECLARIQLFVSGDECVKWLNGCLDLDPSQNSNGKKSVLFSQPDLVDIVGKPEINFVKPNTLRLICRLKNGRTKCKTFKCGREGKNDKAAMKAIHDFLNGESFNEWLLYGKGRQRSYEDEWKFFKYINTGVDTKNFVDNIPFDVKQNFILNRRGHEIVIHRDQRCNREVLVENPLWGMSHRLDDTYSLKKEPLNKGTVAVCFLLSCASRTDECRTECGKFIKDVEIVDNSLNCCGHILQYRHCTHCFTSTTPQWCRKDNSTILCKNCDTYLRTHGTPRPSHLWKESFTTNFKHLKCNWKLKFVLRSDDMSRWHVYKSIYNNQSHNIVIQERKRSTLNAKDKCIREWVKAQGSDRPRKAQCDRKRKRDPALEDNSSHSPSQLQDTKTPFPLKTEEDGVLYPVEYPEESVHYMETYEDYVQDGGVITEVENSLEGAAGYQYHEEDNEASGSSLHPKKIIKSEEITCERESGNNEEASMVCIKCIQEEVTEIFCCSNKKELDVHISKCHQEELFACAACYTENNIVVTFHNESLFKEHMKLHAPKKNM